MSGHGFKLSPAVGEMVAALVTGERPPVSATPFRLDRFDLSVASGATFVSSYLRPAGSPNPTGPGEAPGR
jgi:hypothetical protein